MSDSPTRITAGDREYEERIQRLSDRLYHRVRYHSIDLPDGSILPGLQPVEHLRWRLDLFGLPADLHGKRVLDIGAWDGWFSFECERRGAEVVAMDCVALDTFIEAKQILGSRVEYHTMDVNELSAARLGRFDIVLFFGVFYHLRHPLSGLEKAVELSTDLALVESFVIPSENRPIPAVMEFYERRELGGQIDNWFGPTPECLTGMCRSAGFAQVELKNVSNQRASIICRRRWPEPDVAPSADAPQLHAAVNNRTYKAIFHPLKDEYLSCFFQSPEKELMEDSVFVEVDGFGTQALFVAATEGGYQANCLRPPGLRPGPHEVRLRTRHSPRSNSVGFTMLDESGRDILHAREPFPAGPPELCGVEMRPAGDLRLAVNRGGSLECYFRTPAQSVTAADVTIEAEGRPEAAHSISALGDGVWQANILLNRPIAAGSPVRIRLGEGEWSPLLPAHGKQ